MNYQFSQHFNYIEPSMIRSVLVKASGKDMINFSPGFPDHEAFPINIIQQISKNVLENNPDMVLQYACSTTFDSLKKELIFFFNREEKIFKNEDDLMVTSGSGEGLEMATKVFLNDGDVVVVEDPTYVGALNGFKSNGARLVGIPVEEDGMNLDLLEKSFNQVPRPKLLYMIPTFQNPTTVTTSLEKRQAIYKLCKKYKVIILEDNPYGSLRFQENSIPTMKSMDTEGIVVYFASLSKIISPGLRVGAIVANRDIIEHFNILKEASGGAVTNWSQLVIAEFLKKVNIDNHLNHIQNIYKCKSSMMYETMLQKFHPDVRIRKPDGGMFIWFELPQYSNPKAFLDLAIANHIAIVSEETFAVNRKKQRYGFRLSFTSASMEQIVRGITMLGKFSYQVIKSSSAK